MPESLAKRDRLIYGVLLPIGAMIIGIFVIMQVTSGADAAEFASLGVMLGTIVVLPIVLTVNGVLAFRPADSPKACFKRGMIAPTIILAGAIIYQTGLWDALT